MLQAHLQKIKFLVVGGFAFIVDVFVYFFCEQIVNLSPFWARIIAFMVAVAVAWLGNRLFTFSDRQSKQVFRQFLKAFAVSSFSLLPNMLVFLSLLNLLPQSILFTFIAFSCGTAVGIVSNYILSHKYVFTQ